MRFDSQNSTLIIEITNMCNLSCIMCEIDRTKKGFMSTDDFTSILHKIRESRFKFNIFLPFWKGEPLIHPQFTDMMQIYSSINSDNAIACNSGFDTNAHFLDSQIAEFILKSSLFSVITLSIDAASSDTYKSVRGREFEKIIKNIDYLIKLKKDSQEKLPNIVFQFIVMEENVREIRDFIKMITDILSANGIEDITINYDYDKPFPIGEYTILFRKALYKDRLKQQKSNRLFFVSMSDLFGDVEICSNENTVCGGPFSHIAIDFEGNVFPCCVENKVDFSLGNILKQDIEDIICSQNMIRLRQYHLGIGECEIATCKNCSGQVFPKYTKKNIDMLKGLF